VILVCFALHLLSRVGSKKTLGRQGLFLPVDQVRRCREMSREISTIEVLPVNSNLTFPNDEK
jgi:hypothetical protein